MLKIIIVHGGLGNQMFAYAFSCAFKKKYPFSFVSLDMLEPWDAHNGHELLKVFPLIKGKTFRYYRRQWKIYSLFFTKHFFKIQKEIEADYCSYNAQLIKSTSLFQLYDGYWQSEKYFKSAERIVRKKFSFDKSKMNTMSSILLEKLERENNIVSVHIRRGDYKEYQHYFGGICTLDYYLNAIRHIQKIDSTSVFCFFSDDMNWVRENLKIENAIYVDWNLREDSWQDMFLMSKCKHNIIANSSFSWWGAWLNDNPDKIVIAPQKWFNSIDAKDIIPNAWIRI